MAKPIELSKFSVQLSEEATVKTHIRKSYYEKCHVKRTIGIEC